MTGALLFPILYAALAVFAAGFLARAMRLARLPVHLRWELAPVPHEKGRAHYGGSYLETFEWWTKPREKSLLNEAVYMFLEIVFLKSVWERQRNLWWFSFPFHFGLYLLVALAGVAGIGAVAALLGAVELPLLAPLLWILAAGGYALGLLGAAGLLASRLAVPDLKAYSAPAHYFNLLLLLAVFGTGGAALLAVPAFPASLVGTARACLTAGFSLEVPGILAAHLLVTAAFLAYLPFTPMMHFLAKYFTYHQVRWDDRPLVDNPRIEAEVGKLLSQPVSWSAPHIKADGKKTWAQIATEDIDS